MVSDEKDDEALDHELRLRLELIQSMVDIHVAPVKERLERLENKVELDIKEQRRSFSEEWHRLEDRLATRYRNQLTVLGIIVTIILTLITIVVNVVLRLLQAD